MRAEATEINNKFAAAHRQYNPQSGNALAANIEKSKIAADKIALDFYEGRITRGEYNKRRLDFYAQANADAQRIIRGN